jgi:hypothetical protein
MEGPLPCVQYLCQRDLERDLVLIIVTLQRDLEIYFFLDSPTLVVHFHFHSLCLFFCSSWNRKCAHGFRLAFRSIPDYCRCSCSSCKLSNLLITDAAVIFVVTSSAQVSFPFLSLGEMRVKAIWACRLQVPRAS